MLWVTVELDGRRVKLSGRDEKTGKQVTLRLSRPAAATMSMALRSVVKVKPAEPFDFGFHGELETA